MRNQLPSISESPTDLSQRLKAEKDGKKRQRLQALYLLASGQTRWRLALATLLAVHRHTIKTGSLSIIPPPWRNSLNS